MRKTLHQADLVTSFVKKKIANLMNKHERDITLANTLYEW